VSRPKLPDPTLWVVVVLDVKGDVHSVVGPFWEHSTAVQWAYNAKAIGGGEKHQLTFEIVTMIERNTWRAS
jgi:hypothetical protein